MSELNAQDLLDWQKLHDWASAKPEGSEIGVTCTNSRCPVANYLHEQTQTLWSVGASIKAMDGTKYRLDKRDGQEILRKHSSHALFCPPSLMTERSGQKAVQDDLHATHLSYEMYDV